MKHNKAISPFLSILALAVTAIYLLYPLEEQVASLAHTISHKVFEKAPKHHHHDESITHNHRQDAQKAVAEHNHNLLNLIKKITEGNQTSDHNAVVDNQIKVDKHIPSTDYEVYAVIHIISSKKENWNYLLEPYTSFISVPTAPPKV